MEKYFYFEDCSIPHYLILRPDFNLLPLKYTEGSYGVLPARLMNLSYAQYCRMCRDLLGAKVIGKNSPYPTVYFEDNGQSRKFLDLLNKRVKLIFTEKSIKIKEQLINQKKTERIEKEFSNV